MERKCFTTIMSETEQKIDEGKIKDAKALIRGVTKYDVAITGDTKRQHLYLAGFLSGMSTPLNHSVLPDFKINHDINEFMLASKNGYVPKELSLMTTGFIHGVIQKIDD